MKEKPTYNRKIHHRRTIRLKEFDYSQPGAYFITICCKDRRCIFGEIVNGEMILNQNGIIAQNEWLHTMKVRPNVECYEFVIMPNHMHGIIHITRRGESHSPQNNIESHSPQNNIESHSPQNNIESHSPQNDVESHSPVLHETQLSSSRDDCKSSLRGPSQTIGAIVRGYKSAVTRRLNLSNVGPVIWQKNYYEHIIRDEQSFQNISQYITNNPAKWEEDKLKRTEV